MKFKLEVLESELSLFDTHHDIAQGGNAGEFEVEIFNVEENELVLRTFTLDSGQQDYTLLKSALQIGKDEIFLYGWLKNENDVSKVRYKLKPV